MDKKLQEKIDSMAIQRGRQYTSQELYAGRGRKGLKAFFKILSANPTALSEMLLAVDLFLPSQEGRKNL